MNFQEITPEARRKAAVALTQGRHGEGQGGVQKAVDAAILDHDCYDYGVPYTSDEGDLGHGWECGKCGAFLQVG